MPGKAAQWGQGQASYKIEFVRDKHGMLELHRAESILEAKTRSFGVQLLKLNYHATTLLVMGCSAMGIADSCH